MNIYKLRPAISQGQRPCNAQCYINIMMQDKSAPKLKKDVVCVECVCDENDNISNNVWIDNVKR